MDISGLQMFAARIPWAINDLKHVFHQRLFIELADKMLWCLTGFNINIRADSGFVPSQWETSLQSNAVSHWLGANLESSPNKYQKSPSALPPTPPTPCEMITSVTLLANFHNPSIVSSNQEDGIGCYIIHLALRCGYIYPSCNWLAMCIWFVLCFISMTGLVPRWLMRFCHSLWTTESFQLKCIQKHHTGYARTLFTQRQLRFFNPYLMA